MRGRTTSGAGPARRRPRGPACVWIEVPALADMALGHGCQFVYAGLGTVAFIGETRFPFEPGPSETIAVRVLVRPPGHVDRRVWARAVRETKRAVAVALREAATGVQPILNGTRHGPIRILING